MAKSKVGKPNPNSSRRKRAPKDRVLLTERKARRKKAAKQKFICWNKTKGESFRQSINLHSPKACTKYALIG